MTMTKPMTDSPRPTAGLRTVVQAAAWLGVSARTVRRMIGRGELPCVRVGRLVRIRAEDLNLFVVMQRA